MKEFEQSVKTHCKTQAFTVHTVPSYAVQKGSLAALPILWIESVTYNDSQVDTQEMIRSGEWPVTVNARKQR